MSKKKKNQPREEGTGWEGKFISSDTLGVLFLTAFGHPNLLGSWDPALQSWWLTTTAVLSFNSSEREDFSPRRKKV